MKILTAPPCGAVFDTFFTPENIALAESMGEVVWNDTARRLTTEDLKERIGGCDVYVATWGAPPLTAEVLKSADRLKLLVVLGSSVAPYVTPEVWERGIRVISGADLFARSTAEGALAYILAAQRDIPYYSERLQKNGIWKAPTDFTCGLLYKKVGIVGYGGVGRHLARMLQPFEVDLAVYDIVEIPKEEQQRYHFRQCGLKEVFSTCDIVSLHTPYYADTHHLIGEELLSLMPRGALLVNTARGAVTDQKVLTEKLRSGAIRAALDVYEQEPLPAEDPLLQTDSRTALLMPHMGGVTTDLRQRVTRELLTEAWEFLCEGAPLRNEILKEKAVQMSIR